MALQAWREWATELAESTASLKACSEPMPGLRAPARTARPTPEVPSSTRVAATILPWPASWSMPSTVRITTSALSPAAIDLRSACVAWYSTRKSLTETSSAPFRASVLSTVMSLKGGFDGDIDVIGAPVYVAEEL